MRAKKKTALQESLNHIDQLKKKDFQKTEFFLAASHQLKAPVAIIQWCLQSVLENDSLKNRDREMVVKAVTQADAMSHLITDMLHVFRLVNRKDQKTVTYTLVNVNELVAQLIHEYKERANKQHVHLESGPAETLPPVLAEAMYLRQALLNLIDNAIKYSPRGGHVTVSVAAPEEGWIEISVADQGIGISDLEREKLFQEFFRGVEAQDVAHEGTGLGLVLVKHVVEELGGEVTVKSRLHQGSCFTMRIPAK